MTLLEIIQVEGIVIRHIEKVTTSLFSEHKFFNEPNQELIYSEKFGRNMCKETKTNSLGGKYLVTIDHGLSEIVLFNRFGIGETVEEAYAEFLKIDEMDLDTYRKYAKESRKAC